MPVQFRPGPPPRPRRRARTAWVVSALLHAALLAALLWRAAPPPEMPLPPPDIGLVFESGSTTKPTTPEPAERTTLPAAAAPPPAPAPAATPAPAPPTREAAAPRARPPLAPRPAIATAFPRPLMPSWSLGNATAPTSASMSRPAATQAERGPSRSDSFDVRGADRLGPDWMNVFSAWVEQHKRYPEQAALNDEDGTNQVDITVARDGRVLDVAMAGRSGSQWLDLGTLSMFRGRRLPPFPDDAHEDRLTIQLTMHYIIQR